MIKQVIVMRTDLNMRKGKMCVQAAHASMKVLLDHGQVFRNTPDDKWPYFESAPISKEFADWLEGSFTKICVQAVSEVELLELHEKAKVAGIPCSLINDAGKTEFHDVVTPTCIAIGPAKGEDIDKITGGLKLL